MNKLNQVEGRSFFQEEQNPEIEEDSPSALPKRVLSVIRKRPEKKSERPLSSFKIKIETKKLTSWKKDDPFTPRRTKRTRSIGEKQTKIFEKATSSEESFFNRSTKKERDLIKKPLQNQWSALYPNAYGSKKSGLSLLCSVIKNIENKTQWRTFWEYLNEFGKKEHKLPLSDFISIVFKKTFLKKPKQKKISKKIFSYLTLTFTSKEERDYDFKIFSSISRSAQKAFLSLLVLNLDCSSIQSLAKNARLSHGVDAEKKIWRSFFSIVLSGFLQDSSQQNVLCSLVVDCLFFWSPDSCKTLISVLCNSHKKRSLTEGEKKGSSSCVEETFLEQVICYCIEKMEGEFSPKGQQVITTLYFLAKEEKFASERIKSLPESLGGSIALEIDSMKEKQQADLSTLSAYGNSKAQWSSSWMDRTLEKEIKKDSFYSDIWTLRKKLQTLGARSLLNNSLAKAWVKDSQGAPKKLYEALKNFMKNTEELSELEKRELRFHFLKSVETQLEKSGYIDTFNQIFEIALEEDLSSLSQEKDHSDLWRGTGFVSDFMKYLCWKYRLFFEALADSMKWEVDTTLKKGHFSVADCLIERMSLKKSLETQVPEERLKQISTKNFSQFCKLIDPLLNSVMKIEVPNQISLWSESIIQTVTNHFNEEMGYSIVANLFFLRGLNPILGAQKKAVHTMAKALKKTAYKKKNWGPTSTQQAEVARDTLSILDVMGRLFQHAVEGELKALARNAYLEENGGHFQVIQLWIVQSKEAIRGWICGKKIKVDRSKNLARQAKQK